MVIDMMTAEQLKGAILQLALQGMLIPQNANDKSASELLRDDQRKKAITGRRSDVKQKKQVQIIRKDGEFVESDGVKEKGIQGRIPFEIPDTWEWIHLGYVCDIARGGSPRPIKSFLTEREDGINWIKIGDTDIGGKYINSTKEKIIPEGMKKSRFVHAGDFLLTNSMSFGRPYILNCDGCIHDGWLVLTGYKEVYEKDFLYYMLSSRYAFNQFCEVVSGAVVKNLNSDKVAEAVFPVPPMEEQKRIVAKIEELMPFVEQYATASTKLNTLNATFPEMMKKSILQEAVQGKLVPQDPDDEPASVLLEKIAEEKKRLIKEGKIKKQKPLPAIMENEIPFDIPENWKWVRLGNIIDLLSGTDFKPNEYSDISGNTVYITGASCLSDTGVISQRWTDFPKNIAHRGDLLLVCKGSGYGKTVICDVDEAHIARQIMAIRKIGLLNLDYVRLFLRSNLLYIKESGQGVIPGIDRGTILNMIFPLPPLEEQGRIVSFVDNVMKYISRLL